MIACVVKSKEASCSFSVVNIDNNWRKGNGWMYLMGERQKENKRDGVMRPRTKWKTYKRRQNNCRKRHMDSYFKHLFLQDNLLCFADSCVRACVGTTVWEKSRLPANYKSSNTASVSTVTHMTTLLHRSVSNLFMQPQSFEVGRGNDSSVFPPWQTVASKPFSRKLGDFLEEIIPSPKSTTTSWNSHLLNC